MINVCNLIVSRFGGIAAATADEVKKTAEIIRSNHARRFVVISAPGATSDSIGMTDMLYICHARSSSRESYDDILWKIEQCYKNIVDGLGIKFDIDTEINALKKSLELGMNLDYIGSRGEYIMAKIFAEFLGWEFVDASKIIFFGRDGKPDKEKTFREAGEKLKHYERAVIPSFYGTNYDGKIKTFPRGDCDTAGALIACAVHADMFEKWSESAKIFSADPAVIHDSEVIRNITYMEALEMNYIGIKIVTDDVIFMLDEAAIPMALYSTHAPKDDAMLITPKLSEKISRNVTACIAGHNNFTIIHIHKYGLNNAYDFGEKLFGLFAKRRIACRYYLSGIHKMSVVLKAPGFDLRRDEIIDEIKKVIEPYAIIVEKGLSLVAAVGEGIGQAPGTFRRIFEALSHENIEIKMLEHGADNLNIIVGVSDKDYDKAIKALYRALVLHEEGE